MPTKRHGKKGDGNASSTVGLAGRQGPEGTRTVLLIHRGVCLGLAALLVEEKGQKSADHVKQGRAAKHTVASKPPRGL